MKIEIEKRENGWHMAARENERLIVVGHGATPKEAAHWLVHHIHRMAGAIEDFAIEAGYLTSEEIDAIAGT